MTEMPDAKLITGSQVRAIHVTLSRAGIDDETYRGILNEGYGVDTCKALTRRQASELLRQLGVALRNPPGKRPKSPRTPTSRAKLPPGVTRLSSPAQRQLIHELASEIPWREPDGYARWLKQNQGIRRVATAQQAARVIEGLKALKKRWPAGV